jgi:Flp pilus assembly pilin Flp
MRERMRGLWKSFTDDSGQGMVEYILIIGLIVLFIVVILIVFRKQLNNFLNKISAWIGGQSVPSPASGN